MGIYELLFWYILAFIGGWLFGTTFSKSDDRPAESNNMQELSFCEECEGCEKFEPLNKPNVYITDLLLTELVTALNMNYIELPSFGTVPLNSPDNLRDTFWRCVEADKLFGTDTTRKDSR